PALNGNLPCRTGIFYRSIETGASAAILSTRPTRRFGKSLHHQRRKLGSDPFDRDVFLGIPGGDCVAHSKDRQSRKSGVCVFAKRALVDAGLDHVLDGSLQRSRPPPDPLPALGRQVLPLRQKDAYEVASPHIWRD